MVYNDTTIKDGAVQMMESLCLLGDGGITNDTTLFAKMTGLYNQAVKETEEAIMKVDKNWKWDDFNYTDFPIATIDLADQQRDYTLPASTSGGNSATLWKVNRIRIKGIDGLYYPIDPLTPSEEETQVGTTYSGTPRNYRLNGGSVRLSPIPKTGNVTMTAGLEVQFQREGVKFTVSDTTKQAPIPSSFHDIPCLKASAMYLLPLNPSLASSYFALVNKRIDELETAWSNRNDDNKNQIIPKSRSSR